MARNPFENPVSLTAARKAYAMSLFDMCYARVARDLDNDTTTEGVAIPALAQIVAAYTPHAGKGHAEDTRLWVADQVAALRTPDAAQEAQAQEAQAQEAQAQEAPAQEAPAQEAQAQEAPAQEAPAQEAPAQEAPAQEAPAQEKKLARRKAA
jgi:FtsZ-interacting cell division protein ZipA